MFRSIYLLLAVVVSTGCTNTAHQRLTNGHASTSDQLYRQQVADNLAKFTNDPNALPHFSVPSQGGTSVDDSGGLMTALGFDPFGFVSSSINPGFQRGVRVSWAMEPVSDPAKLARMRVLYQEAVANPWYAHGKRADVPKHNKCLVIGHNCGSYVWISPECGSDQLSNLTLAILDVVLNYPHSPPAPPTKKVEIVSDYTNGKNPVPIQRKETYESLLDETDKNAVPKATSSSENVPNMRLRSLGTGPLGFRQSLDLIAPPSRQR